MVKSWLDLGTKTTWLGLRKDHSLGKNNYLVKVRETLWFGLKLLLTRKKPEYIHIWEAEIREFGHFLSKNDWWNDEMVKRLTKQLPINLIADN